MTNRGWLVLIAALGTALPAGAAPNPKKIDRLVESEKSDKAWSLCAKELAKQEIEDPVLYEACAAARFAWLTTANPDGVTVPHLEEFWLRWEGTFAASGARELASRMLLEEARDDGELLWEIAGDFPETEAGATATTRLYEQALASGTSSAALAFALDFPEAPQAEQAMIRARELAWGEASKLGSSGGWRTFLDEWPAHPRRGEGEDRWKEALFTEAAAEDTAVVWRQFLDEWPAHPRLAEATKGWHKALFREAEEAGPLALLALAERHPDHPKALKAREAAQRRSAQVFLKATREGTFWPLTMADHPSERAKPIAFDSIRVQRPREGESPVAQLVLVRDGEDIPAMRLGEVIAEHGFPIQLTESSYEPVWGHDVEGSLEGQQLVRLCQPDGDTWFAVVVQVGGPPQRFPFRVPDRCASLDGPFEPETSFTITRRAMIFGSTRDAFLERFPEFTAHRFSDPDTQCRASDPYPQLCALFHRDLLYGIYLERAGDGAITKAEREVGDELRGQFRGATTHSLPDDRPGVTHHRSPGFWAWDQYTVGGETGDPWGATWVVHPGLLRFVRGTDGEFQIKKFPEI